MTSPRDAIEVSYAYCRQLNRRVGSSFLLAFLLLPREKRRAMDALYAFMRHTDDIADAPCATGFASASPDATLAEPVRVPGSLCRSDLLRDRSRGAFGGGKNLLECTLVAPKRAALEQWRSALEQALDPSALHFPPSAFSSPSILPALADAVRRFHVPAEHLTAVIDGVAMDLDERRYQSYDDLQVYCERVASAVGLACIQIWGFRGSEAIEFARRAGIALQLTNILRDLREDADAGRVYLPLDDLRTCGYSEADLRAATVNEPFFRLMRLEIDRAEKFYAESAALMPRLEPSGRRIFGLIWSTYRTLLRKIAERPEAVLARRVRLSRLRRIQLAARWSLLPPSLER